MLAGGAGASRSEWLAAPLRFLLGTSSATRYYQIRLPWPLLWAQAPVRAWLHQGASQEVGLAVDVAVARHRLGVTESYPASAMTTAAVAAARFFAAASTA